jgi:hypothetical protein
VGKEPLPLEDQATEMGLDGAGWPAWCHHNIIADPS